MMDYDPILREMHEIKEQIAGEAGYDMRKLCDHFRVVQEQYADRLVTSVRQKPETTCLEREALPVP